MFSFLRTIVMNLLRCSGYRSIRQGLRELAREYWRWEEWQWPSARRDRTFRQPWVHSGFLACFSTARWATATKMKTLSSPPPEFKEPKTMGLEGVGQLGRGSSQRLLPEFGFILIRGDKRRDCSIQNQKGTT